jgi:hypothetical protein
MAEVDRATGASQAETAAAARDRIIYESGTGEDKSIAQLLGELIADAQELMRKEVLLAKLEVKEEINKAKDGAISLGIGGVVAAIGGLLLIQMLVHFLATVVGIPLWVSYLIVGGLLAIVGVVLLLRGKSRVTAIDPVPHETIESVRKDVEWIKEQTPSERTSTPPATR